MRFVSTSFSCLFLSLVVLIPLICPGISLAQPWEEDLATWDPLAADQIDKTGRYMLELDAIPAHFFIEIADQMRVELPQAAPRADYPAERTDDKPWGYQIFASPKTYSREHPAGLVVYISASNDPGGFLRYQSVFEQRNVLFIGLRDMGNQVPPPFRIGMAIYAVNIMSHRYAIDPDRIYITGGSGGGIAASWAMFYRPDVFAGGFPMNGAAALWDKQDFTLRDVQQGLALPGLPTMPHRDLLRRVVDNGRYVTLTGTEDYNKDMCVNSAAQWSRLGLTATSFVEPGIGHEALTAPYIQRTFDFLDQPLIDRANQAIESARANIERNRPGEALVELESTVMHLRLDKSQGNEVRRVTGEVMLDGLLEQLSAEMAAFKTALDDGDARAAQQALRTLQRNWRGAIDDETFRFYRDQIREVQRGER